jgi:ABC-type nickel/cobalt efflux system permease component RcnA
MKLAVLLAQLDTLNPLGPIPPLSKTAGLAFRDLMLIGGAILVLTGLLVFWARRYVQRSKRHHRRGHHTKPLVVTQNGSSSRSHRHHHHRHRRRQPDPAERGKNPTLAETGGLPPLRPEAKPNPPA